MGWQMSAPSKASVMQTLLANEGDLRAMGIETVFLFGPVARGDATPTSDADLFFEHRPEVRGLDLIGLYLAPQNLFEGPVDAVVRDTIHPALKPHIEADAIQVF